MLQQTRVEAVIPYFYRFIEKYADVFMLADATEVELLKAWEGLGYYNRVKNMQKAALQVVEKYHGILPASYEKLLDLPGIGEYTAGAIASIAFGLPYAAVDGNVMRVMARYLGYQEDSTKEKNRRWVKGELEKVMPDCPADFNQALMEIGALICLPHGMPKCESCPLAITCVAKKKEMQLELPYKKNKKKRKQQKMTVFLLKEKEKIAVQKRKSTGLLAGMYQLPNVEKQLNEKDAKQQIEAWGFRLKKLEQTAPYTHIFTHIEWNMKGYVAVVESQKQCDDFEFITKKQLQKEYPLPSAFKPFVKYSKL